MFSELEEPNHDDKSMGWAGKQNMHLQKNNVITIMEFTSKEIKLNVNLQICTLYLISKSNMCVCV